MPQKSLLSWSGYTFDVVSSVSVTDEAPGAKHRLEDGADVEDHFFFLPVPVQAEVLISDIPGDGSEYQQGRGDTVYLSLLQDLGAGTTDDLTTADRSHHGMRLALVQRTRSTPEGAARLSLRWEPVRRASSQEVAVPLPHTSTVAAGKSSVGKKTPTAPPAATTTKSRSILSSLIGG